MAVLTVVDMMIPPITLDPGWAGDRRRPSPRSVPERHRALHRSPRSRTAVLAALRCLAADEHDAVIGDAGPEQ